MMGHRAKLAGDGYDAFSRAARKLMGWRSGVLQQIKRRYSRRDRKTAKVELRKNMRNDS